MHSKQVPATDCTALSENVTSIAMLPSPASASAQPLTVFAASVPLPRLEKIPMMPNPA